MENIEVKEVKTLSNRAAYVAVLAEWLLPLQEVCSLNLVSGKIL